MTTFWRGILELDTCLSLSILSALALELRRLRSGTTTLALPTDSSSVPSNVKTAGLFASLPKVNRYLPTIDQPWLVLGPKMGIPGYDHADLRSVPTVTIPNPSIFRRLTHHRSYLCLAPFETHVYSPTHRSPQAKGYSRTL